MITRLAGFDPSINTFFNALIRELGSVEYRASHKEASHGCFVLHNPLNHERLLVPCLFRSGTGRHTLGAHLLTERAGHLTPVTFRSAIEWCLRLPELRQESTATTRQRFLATVLNGHHQLPQPRAASQGQRSLSSLESPMSFIESEQTRVVTLPDQPFPYTRDGMQWDGALLPSPEPGQRLPLAWYSLDRQYLTTSQASGPGVGALMATLIDTAAPLTLAARPPGHILLPCHPVQHYHWQGSAPIRHLQQQGKVRFLGVGQPQWQATSSPRTLWSDEHDWMLQFSLSTTLPGYHSHLSRSDVSRGPALARLLDRPALRHWLRHRPHFAILREPVTLSLCDESGQDLEDTRMTLTSNPFRGQRQDRSESLAVLLQEDPGHGQSRLAMALVRHRTSPRQWFQQFLDRIADPLLEAQSRFGLLLSGHPQNLILGLDSGFLPERLWYRGARDSMSVGPQKASATRRDRNRQAEEEAAIRLFCHDLFVDSIFNIISSLARAELSSEGELLTLLKRWLSVRHSAVHQDSRAMDYLLASPCLFARSTILANLRDPDAPGAVANDAPLCYPVPNPLSPSAMPWPATEVTGFHTGGTRAAV